MFRQRVSVWCTEYERRKNRPLHPIRNCLFNLFKGHKRGSKSLRSLTFTLVYIIFYSLSKQGNSKIHDPGCQGKMLNTRAPSTSFHVTPKQDKCLIVKYLPLGGITFTMKD